jgi:hypothetical protein
VIVQRLRDAIAAAPVTRLVIDDVAVLLAAALCSGELSRRNLPTFTSLY